ncbi:sigma-70 family RNA polymerase sigma factor [Winogradskyella sp.]|uniref:RNA polymerase sigma factor n=1 Tax=Winogradskyella sp. TaxID=1883156 RepID=UPI00261B7A9F|nr:sigma-70 family RNA polymerase sigma factor [Winogradskyella sp.]
MKTDEHIDEVLVEAFKAGDKKALAALVKRWHKQFCNKAYWMVNDKDAAKDIAQDSWTTIIDKIDKLKDPKRFKYWAFRIVCNKSTDWLRLQAKNRNNTINHEVEIKSVSGNNSEKEQLKQLLLKTVDELPKNQSTVIRLFYLQSYSLKQISDLLEISIGTAKSRLFHAREKIKTILKNSNYEN